MSDKISKIINIPRGLTSKTFLPIIQQLNDYTIQREFNHLVINFSDTIFVSPGGLTPLLCYLRELPKIYPDSTGEIIPSENISIDLYISRMGFYNMLGIQDDYEFQKTSGEGRFQELYCFNKDTEESEVLIRNEQVVKAFTHQSKNQNYIKAINWCLCELVDNARNHAVSDECILFAQKYKADHLTEFCVVDRGLGIRQTMGDDNIITALTRCIRKEKGINSKGAGAGLYFTTELIKNDKSKNRSLLKIYSEDGMVTVNSGQEPIIEKTNTFWKGTIVTLSLSDEIETNLAVIKGSEIYGWEDLPDFYTE